MFLPRDPRLLISGNEALIIAGYDDIKFLFFASWLQDFDLDKMMITHNNSWYASKFSHSKVQTFHKIHSLQTFISQILKVVGPFGKKIKCFIALGIQIEKDLNYLNTRIELQSIRALKRYLHNENLTHRKTATI